ncbi:amidohydrolase [Persicobacter diffluens]|uniref:Amidohydrolase n=1 Tax=Persicobacter diffluens TaxID=981 RepID=A0AAN4W5S7_9BACT|nr:amidohydrolase [Persicobacter diffluens]
MKVFRIMSIGAAVLVGLFSFKVTTQPVADMIFLNGNIHTVNAQNEVVSAIAISEGKIIKVGTDQEILKFKGSNTQCIDLEEKMVIPGIIDAHIHPDAEADNRLSLNFPQTSTWKEAEQAIRAQINAHPHQQWFIGGTLGWIEDEEKDILGMGIPSHKKSLDAISTEVALGIYDIGYHAMLVNSKALELAGVTANTPDPKGGTINKDQNGEPTGVLRELAINYLVEKAVIDRSEAWRNKGLRPFMEEMTALGVTGMADAYTKKFSADAYLQLEEEGNLNQYIFGFITSPIDCSGKEAKAEQSRLIANRSRYKTELIQMDGVKYIMDGSAGGQTACMKAPFEGTHHCGDYRNDPVEVAQDIFEKDQAGIMVKAHAIGDRSINDMLEAVNACREVNPHGPRHSIAHCVFTDPQDIHKFADYDVIFEASPALWFPNDGAELIKKDLGEERIKWAWAVRQVVDQGGVVCYGSDWPVAPSPNPWYAMETMITRAKPGAPYGSKTWNPEAAIDLATALRIFTFNGAFSMNIEKVTGSLEAGKSADFLVLNQNLETIPANEIHETLPLMTVFQGKVVFQNEQL